MRTWRTSRGSGGSSPSGSCPTTATPRRSPVGGYSTSLITATEQYIEILRRLPENRELAEVCAARAHRGGNRGRLDQLLHALRGGPSRERGHGPGVSPDERADQCLRAADRRGRSRHGGGARGDRLRRFRLPVLRRCLGAPARAAAAALLPALPDGLEAPAGAGAARRRRGGGRSRAPSGRCATRSTPIAGASTTRTSGSGRSGSASISSGSTPTAAPMRSAQRVERDFASGIRGRRRRHAHGVRRRRAAGR